jgi:hypothetical protein
VKNVHYYFLLKMVIQSLISVKVCLKWNFYFNWSEIFILSTFKLISIRSRLPSITFQSSLQSTETSTIYLLVKKRFKSWTHLSKFGVGSVSLFICHRFEIQSLLLIQCRPSWKCYSLSKMFLFCQNDTKSSL